MKGVGLNEFTKLMLREFTSSDKNEMDDKTDITPASSNKEEEEVANEGNKNCIELGEHGEEVRYFPLADIQHDPYFDCRVSLNEETIERYTGRFNDYKEALDNGEERDYPFPPIVVRFDDTIAQFVRITGSLRYQAAHNVKLDKILVRIFYGSKADALKFAFEDNSKNPAPLTEGDLKFCIQKAHKQFHDKTSGVIADMLGCSRQYVDKVLGQLATSCNVTVPEKKQGKDKKWYPSKRKNTSKRKGTIKPSSSNDCSGKSSNPIFGQQIDKASKETLEPEKSENNNVVQSEDYSWKLFDALARFNETLNQMPEDFPQEELDQIIDLMGIILKHQRKCYRAAVKREADHAKQAPVVPASIDDACQDAKVTDQVASTLTT